MTRLLWFAGGLLSHSFKEKLGIRASAVVSIMPFGSALQKEIGKKPEEITLKEFVEHLTPQRVQQALKGSKSQARELIDHALNVAECAESSVALSIKDS